MSVESALGLDPRLPERIAAVWPAWTALRPDLILVDEPARLRVWLRQADRLEADAVLHGLVWLASTSGGRDTLAAQAVAWAFLPAATELAFRFRTLTDNIDHLVASELWACVRTFPLERRKVAANLVRGLRTRVVREHAASLGANREGRVVTTPVGWLDDGWLAPVSCEPEPTAFEELLDVLDWARDRGLITVRERELLLHLVDVAASKPACAARSGLGLLSDEGVGEVARRLGVSRTTVKRHARRALDVLVEQAPQYLLTA